MAEAHANGNACLSLSRGRTKAVSSKDSGISPESSSVVASGGQIDLDPTLIPIELVAPLAVDHRYLPNAKMTAIMALWVNGNLLGLTCDVSAVIVSQPQPDHVPKSLHPTALQLSTPHVDWIDRWPFPRMRDNMILMKDVLDFGQIFQDFFLMRSFSVEEGSNAWDAAGWQIYPEFNVKWGYLWC